MWAISLGRVIKRHAMVEGCPDDVEHLGPGGDCRLICAAHVLDAEPDARDLECAEPAAPRTQVLLRAACARRPEGLGLRHGSNAIQQRGCSHSCPCDKKLAPARHCGAALSMLILRCLIHDFSPF